MGPRKLQDARYIAVCTVFIICIGQELTYTYLYLTNPYGVKALSRLLIEKFFTQKNHLYLVCFGYTSTYLLVLLESIDH